ncbi:MAG TPA: hypothetical protein VGG13_03745 [Candidatus Saccharimonadales bacterium]|jgi:hypothetical protein
MADQQNNRQPTPQISPPVEEPEQKAATPEESKQELQEAIKGSNQVLATATTTLTLFSDTLTVDRAKLTVTKRTFFGTAEVMSIRIEDVLNVTATVGPILGSVKIVSRVLNTEKPYTVGRFWRKDALRLKRVTQGYIIALQRKIDCSSLPTKELAAMLDKLGEDDHVV